MQQPMNANPVHVVVIAHPGIIDKQIKYRNMKTSKVRQLVGLGITQLVIGILCIIFQGVAVWIYVTGRLFSLDFVGHGFWTGILVSHTLMSSIGLRSWKTPILMQNALQNNIIITTKKLIEDWTLTSD